MFICMYKMQIYIFFFLFEIYFFYFISMLNAKEYIKYKNIVRTNRQIRFFCLWMDEWIDGWLVGWMDRQIDGWLNVSMFVNRINVYHHINIVSQIY